MTDNPFFDKNIMEDSYIQYKIDKMDELIEAIKDLTKTINKKKKKRLVDVLNKIKKPDMSGWDDAEKNVRIQTIEKENMHYPPTKPLHMRGGGRS